MYMIQVMTGAYRNHSITTPILLFHHPYHHLCRILDHRCNLHSTVVHHYKMTTNIIFVGVALINQRKVLIFILTYAHPHYTALDREEYEEHEKYSLALSATENWKFTCNNAHSYDRWKGNGKSVIKLYFQGCLNILQIFSKLRIYIAWETLLQSL